ncbi:MAG: PIN domain-containing protein [Deltaproteobacteria bacterium]|nr:PIN domain-containing protein [Deltaproteobacteria bacterium]
MSRGILDTSIVIAQDREDLVAGLPDEAAISVATLAELHYGVLVAKDDETKRQRLRRLGEIEARFSAIAIDAVAARAFAAVAHAVKTAGGKPRARVMDLWIAATALAHRVPVYTRNRSDFDALRKLIDVRSI